MAKRYQNKKQVTEKWNTKIQSVKYVYDQNKLKSDPAFYNSKAYKDLKRRRGRAIYRYEHREEINTRRKENEKIKKETPREFDRVNDTSVYEAYNGAGRIYEDALIQKQKDGLGFKGSVEYKNKTRYFSNYADFRRETNRVISEIYKLIVVAGSDELF